MFLDNDLYLFNNGLPNKALSNNNESRQIEPCCSYGEVMRFVQAALNSCEFTKPLR